MSGWIIAIALSVLTGAASIRFGRIPRSAWELVASALLVGLAGYAWQGNPSLAGAPKQAAARHSAFDEAIPKLRKNLVDRFSQAGKWLLLADALIRHVTTEEAANLMPVGPRHNPQATALRLGQDRRGGVLKNI